MAGFVLATSTSQHAVRKTSLPPVVAPITFALSRADGSLEQIPLADATEMRKLPPEALRLDPALTRAATIAEERAHSRSKKRCWRYVKQALLAAGAVDSYPKTALAKEAGDELVREFGFQQIDVSDPYKAPVGAVLVYDAKNAPGHVEIRTPEGFVSDFKTEKPSRRKLIGVFAKV